MKNNLILLVLVAFIAIAGTIDLNVLENYEGQPVPNYITKDNGVANPQNDAKATLGRVFVLRQTHVSRQFYCMC